MRHLHLTVAVAVLLSTAWAQSGRQRREFKRLPEVEALMRSARWERLEEVAPSRPTQQLRTAALPPLAWLKTSQDADTVPDVPSTQPAFAHDTLLANNAGEEIDPGTSSDCFHSFFDSLYAKGAWLIYNPNQNSATYFGNYLHSPTNTSPDTLYYVGGGIAERYDIDPCALAGSGNSIYIKGIAAQILNNIWSRANDWDRTCGPVMDEVFQPFLSDGAYSIFYQLLDTFMLDIDWNNTGTIPTSFPGDTLAEVSKTLNQVRIGYVYSGGGQCLVAQQYSRLERYDHAYFTTPVEIDSPLSIYAAVRYELYTPGVDNLTDTLFGLIGPAYTASDPCLTGDTLTYGRNAVLVPAYKQSAAQWIFAEWYPQYYLIGYDLNFLLHPIIYEAPGTNGGVDPSACTSTGQVVRSGSQGFGLPYPNPVVECINLKLTTPAATRGSFTLYTVDGQQVMEWTRPVPAGESTVSLDLPTVPAGSYILHARTPYGVASFWVSVVK